MIGTMNVNGEKYPVINAELHFPLIRGARYLDILVIGPGCCSFGLSYVELSLLDNLDDLDGKRIHIHADGESFGDDTLGTNIIGADGFTDGNVWQYPKTVYFYGEIQMDFQKVEDRIYHCKLFCQLTSDDQMEISQLPLDAFVKGTAEFDVEVDEENPHEIG
ncbi:MAG: hypothetical protein JXA11_02970 [Phycisphaerae bacterium]|nr:hypothetical protein [Phycisphaerae bacterium]